MQPIWRTRVFAVSVLRMALSVIHTFAATRTPLLINI
jgi:hypothetical protein